MEREDIPYEAELRAELKRLMEESEELLRRKIEISSRMAHLLDALEKARQPRRVQERPIGGDGA
jgi:hypothetical protein